MVGLRIYYGAILVICGQLSRTEKGGRRNEIYGYVNKCNVLIKVKAKEITPYTQERRVEFYLQK